MIWIFYFLGLAYASYEVGQITDPNISRAVSAIIVMMNTIAIVMFFYITKSIDRILNFFQKLINKP